MTTLNQAAGKVLKSIDKQKEAFGDLGGGTLREFLWSLASGIQTFEGLAEQTGLSKGQVSRVTRTLHTVNYTGEAGLNLVNVSFDPYAPRIKIVSLNDEGVRLLKEEWKMLTGETIK